MALQGQRKNYVMYDVPPPLYPKKRANVSEKIKNEGNSALRLINPLEPVAASKTGSGIAEEPSTAHNWAVANEMGCCPLLAFPRML